MLLPSNQNTVEPCDICGDVGFPEVIVACSKCKINHEHVYCMRIYLTTIPEDWICESCQPKNETASPCRVNQASGHQASKRLRAVTRGKVKFIPADEVIKLSSGNFPVKPSPANSTMLTQKASIGSKNVISKIPSLSLKSNPSVLPVVPGKLPRNGVLHKNPMTDKGGTVAGCNRSNIQKSYLQSIQENFNSYQKCLPSLNAAWRGRFQILEAVASDKLYDGFKAQLPCTVNSKAYKFSSRMPLVLQLESVPMLSVLTEAFQNDCPSLLDIALYFFPLDSTERSRKNLNTIFEFMNAEKLMLRSFIDGIELLVFTSNELDEDSRGTIATIYGDAGYFLWGVFRQNKIDKGIIEILPEMEPVDMDIDMIGGKDIVGRIDHVRKDKLIGLPQNKSALSTKLEKKNKYKHSSDPSLCNSVKKYPNPVDKVDVPPGFEGARLVGLSGRGRVPSFNTKKMA